MVGVGPRGFQGTRRDRPVDLWVPGRTCLPFSAALGNRAATEPVYSEFIARLADGASFDQAEAQLRAASQQVIGQPPIFFRGLGVWPPIRATAEDTARLLLAVTGLVLLIACANPANLMLFRGLARRAQTAMRRVLGANFGHLVRGRFAESLLLGALAGVIGVLLGRWLVDAFQGLSLWRSAAPLQHVSLDWRVATFASMVAVGSAMVSGVAPTLLAARVKPTDAVRRSTSTQTGGNALRRTFAGLQLAPCVALLVGTLLLVATLRNLSRVELGFDPSGVSAVSIAPWEQGYDQARLRPYYRELLRRVREIPGVESASLSFSYPFEFSRGGVFLLRPVAAYGAEPGATPAPVALLNVSPEYFHTLRIPLLAGRPFSDEEFLAGPDSIRRVAIVSQSLARRLLGDRNPIGQYLGPNARYAIVGVVGDTRYRALERTTRCSPSSSTPGPRTSLFDCGTPRPIRGEGAVMATSRNMLVLLLLANGCEWHAS